MCGLMVDMELQDSHGQKSQEIVLGEKQEANS